MTPVPELAPARPLRGLLFLAIIYAAMPVIGLLYAPAAIRSPDGALAGCHAWCRLVRRLARALVGIETEVRGEPPTYPCLVAAKHQSFLDIILIFGAVPRGRFIMKQELVWAPVLGQFGLRIGCVPVRRGQRGKAIRQMLAEVAAGRQAPGQLIIYPQGTRLAPGVRAPYKSGAAALYGELGQPCVPVACNVGLFWGRNSIALRPGRAVVEFLAPIPPGLPPADFTARLEEAVEPASDRLMAEAGFRAP